MKRILTYLFVVAFMFFTFTFNVSAETENITENHGGTHAAWAAAFLFLYTCMHKNIPNCTFECTTTSDKKDYTVSVRSGQNRRWLSWEVPHREGVT